MPRTSNWGGPCPGHPPSPKRPGPRKGRPPGRGLWATPRSRKLGPPPCVSRMQVGLTQETWEPPSGLRVDEAPCTPCTMRSGPRCVQSPLGRVPGGGGHRETPTKAHTLHPQAALSSRRAAETLGEAKTRARCQAPRPPLAGDLPAPACPPGGLASPSQPRAPQENVRLRQSPSSASASWDKARLGPPVQHSPTRRDSCGSQPTAAPHQV